MIQEQTGRDYLLARLPEAEAETLEQKLLEDEELFVTLRSIEDDLFDDFARGALSDAERQAFLERYRDPARVTFARALAKRGPNVVAMPQRHWAAWGAAAAAVVVIAIAAIVARRPQLHQPSAVRIVSPVAQTVAVNIALVSSRSEGQAAQITLPGNASALLQVRIDPQDRFDAYSIELRSHDRAWRADHLRAADRNGDLIVSAVVPATQLPGGSYELAVRGGDEDLGFVTLEVRRTP